MADTALHIAKHLFESIESAFPALAAEIDEHHWYLDLCLKFPKQKGLDFPISFNLQNGDELHLNVDDFWGSWFPCTDLKVAESFRKAATGLISGNYRLKVLSKRGLSYKRLLQSPDRGGWKTVYNHTSLHWPYFRPQIRYVQNSFAT